MNSDIFQNSMPKTKLPLRKILPMPKRRIRCGNGERFRRLNPGRVKRNASTTTPKLTSRSCLSVEEMNRALALANITTNYQRPDKDLIAAMKKKQRGRTAGPTNSTLDPNTTQSLTPAEETISLSSDSSTLTPLTACDTATPSKQPRKSSDWETQAKKIIERESHSLDRDWSRFSWKQKASNIVRLKLLKDDGYDITQLLKKGVTADEIIDAILAHIRARKGGQSGTYVSTCLDTVTQPETNYDAEINERSACQPDKDDPLPYISDTIYRPSNTSPPHIPQQTHPNTPATLLPQKRKHTQDPSDFSSPPFKKRRIHSSNHTTSTTHTSALQTLKRHLRRSLFASTRTSHSRAYSHLTTSQGTRSQVPILISTPLPAAPTSRIVFTLQEPGRRPSGADTYVTSAAFELLGREVQWLAGGAGVWDCDCELEDEDRVGCGVKLRVKSGEGDAVLEGESRALASLLRHLRDAELMHLGRWRVGDVGVDAEGVRDVEMKVVRNEWFPFHLSPAASAVLGGIAEMLENGRDEVRVGVVRQRARFSVSER
ncbi:hypothetical protein COCCADRAFT_104880 [Bipolaris zeicola 26-R-13]|uniref:Uncharacterized protein n=1 Tax=Cochliobolus carbonum (strain 26-R-13) TaxID=930089 RepID=W6XXP9_COCC2|nr:uncharacterized protein COCCADRAFT_104880 [Bipolaris zeicola 26-R-13]EUC30060.1 hypothetical protein COCCADRAFT_104880 [Bipolaris zeicola 26-R-13]